MKVQLLLLLANLCCVATIPAQTSTTLQPLRVYLELDTTAWLNEDDFLRTEMPWVSYVRSRQDADVQVQITPEMTAPGGRRVGLYFFGNQNFSHPNDTLWYYVLPGENGGSSREKLLRAYQQGLLGYLLGTPWADYVEYTHQPLRFAKGPVGDPAWGRWVLRLQGVGTGNLSRRQTIYRPDNFASSSKTGSTRFNGAVRAEAWQITPRWRTQVGASTLYSRNQPGLAAAVAQQNTTYQTEASTVYSLWSRWAVGVRGNYFWRQLRDNTVTSTLVTESTWGAQLGGGLEYSLLPYRDFFRRRLLAGYYLYVNQNPGVRSSSLVRPLTQEWHLSGAVVQRWGFVNGTVWADHQPRQQVWDTYLLGAQGSVGLRLWRNLFLTADATFTFSNGRYDTSLDDTGGAPLLSSKKARYYNWEMRAGVAYFFGSNKINVVNPRMSGPALTYF